MLVWALVARRTDSALYASAVTLAEVADGTARDANVRRAAKALRVQPVTTEIGYAAGRLRFGAARSRRKPRDLTVDAVVAATALAVPGPAVVLTSDGADLRLLLEGTAVRVEAI
ncbi:twitching motility protein PilT [Nocardioides immobilis]|uniref:Twitching motility protein PilT n=2 Tax=Nocardioides immobilis TaxID=2049295 RepID=A0A417Y3K7_9ACTN|nr:twitching motility protein PilT [Nocardioides immobilis]RHW27258.1 twitching motility protein PilT [Nocardioides immobilis]